MKKFNYYYDFSPENYNYIMSSKILRQSEKELLKHIINGKTVKELAIDYKCSMFIYYNANPYGNNISDCVIRALSVLHNKSWRETYDELTDLAGDVGLMFDRVEFVEDYLDDKYKRECHYSKTIEEFAREHPYGKYAVTMDGHITAIVNGYIIDSFNPSKRVMRCAWLIDK